MKKEGEEIMFPLALMGINGLFFGVLEIWGYFQISKSKIINWKIILLMFLLMVINGGSTLDLRYFFLIDLLVVGVFYLFFREKEESYLILGSSILSLYLVELEIILRPLLSQALNLEIAEAVIIMPILLIIFQGISLKFLREFFYQQLIGANKKIFLWLVVYLYLSTGFLWIIYTFTQENKNLLPLLFGVIILLQMFFGIGGYYALIKIQQELATRKEQEQMQKIITQQKVYTEYLEKEEDKLRAFRHDYKNMLNSLKISIQDKLADQAIIKLENYTEKNLGKISFLKYRDVNHLKIDSLKSILITKLIEMQNLGINYQFECVEEISKLPKKINEYDLTRIIGIVLDNAIEESIVVKNEQNQPKIEIMFFQEKGNFEFEIRNKISQNGNLSISTMKKKKFSTKKNHLGLGLTNIENISKKYPSMTISYQKMNGYFTFYLEVD